MAETIYRAVVSLFKPGGPMGKNELEKKSISIAFTIDCIKNRMDQAHSDPPANYNSASIDTTDTCGKIEGYAKNLLLGLKICH